MNRDTCPRCGAELVTPAGLAVTLAADAEMAREAYSALLTMRLAIPSVVPATLRDLSTRWTILAACLACLAGKCNATECPQDERKGPY